jgi:hypothetical protein
VNSREEFALIVQREPWLARLHYLPDPGPSSWHPVQSLVDLALLVSPWILFVWGLYGWLRP